MTDGESAPCNQQGKPNNALCMLRSIVKTNNRVLTTVIPPRVLFFNVGTALGLPWILSVCDGTIARRFQIWALRVRLS
jgi:hypothetical protein